MPDPVPPPEKKENKGPLRWILLGCGVLTCLGILGMGGCAGLFYFIYKGTDSVAEVGAEYLRNSREFQSALGSEGGSVKRTVFGWNVNLQNDGGNAKITYSIRRLKAVEIGEAVVWLLRSGGQWTAVGARVKLEAGEEIKIGKPSSSFHLPDWD